MNVFLFIYMEKSSYSVAIPAVSSFQNHPQNNEYNHNED